MSSAWKNKLYFGDNLDILREHVADESVDLVYLDPPFNSNQNYNVLFADKGGSKSAAQITAFEDTWHWGPESEKTYYEIVGRGSSKSLSDLLQAYRAFLGESDMMAYLTMMAPRLAELHRVLKPTGSLYLHCDPTASHYLKLLLDAIFRPTRYRNEIIWQRTAAHSDAKQGAKHLGRVHDVILLYVKSDDPAWNQPYIPHDPSYVKEHYPYIDAVSGRRYGLWDITGPGGAAKGNPYYEIFGMAKFWRYSKAKMEEKIRNGRVIQPGPGSIPREIRYLEDSSGVPLGTIWTDITPVNSQAKERLGYPTQKPVALLERILKISSNEGDVILDPFCGCGTAIHAAEKLNRRWIGIDITHLAITLIRSRLHSAFGSNLSPYEVLGVPKDLAGAHALAEQDRYQFQFWALGLVDARPAQDKKKGADSGIDGSITFFDDNSGKARSIIVQVKSGHVNASQIRDLVGVVQREKAEIGAFVTLHEPTEPMKQEAIKAGFYAPPLYGGRTFPKIEIRTIRELLDGRQLEYPRLAVTTFKQAPKESQGEQAALL